MYWIDIENDGRYTITGKNVSNVVVHWIKNFVVYITLTLGGCEVLHGKMNLTEFIDMMENQTGDI